MNALKTGCAIVVIFALVSILSITGALLELFIR